MTSYLQETVMRGVAPAEASALQWSDAMVVSSLEPPGGKIPAAWSPSIWRDQREQQWAHKLPISHSDPHLVEHRMPSSPSVPQFPPRAPARLQPQAVVHLKLGEPQHAAFAMDDGGQRAHVPFPTMDDVRAHARGYKGFEFDGRRRSGEWQAADAREPPPPLAFARQLTPPTAAVGAVHGAVPIGGAVAVPVPGALSHPAHAIPPIPPLAAAVAVPQRFAQSPISPSSPGSPPPYGNGAHDSHSPVDPRALGPQPQPHAQQAPMPGQAQQQAYDDSVDADAAPVTGFRPVDRYPLAAPASVAAGVADAGGDLDSDCDPDCSCPSCLPRPPEDYTNSAGKMNGKGAHAHAHADAHLDPRDIHAQLRALGHDGQLSFAYGEADGMRDREQPRDWERQHRERDGVSVGSDAEREQEFDSEAQLLTATPQGPHAMPQPERPLSRLEIDFERSWHPYEHEQQQQLQQQQQRQIPRDRDRDQDREREHDRRERERERELEFELEQHREEKLQHEIERARQLRHAEERLQIERLYRPNGFASPDSTEPSTPRQGQFEAQTHAQQQQQQHDPQGAPFADWSSPPHTRVAGHVPGHINARVVPNLESLGDFEGAMMDSAHTHAHHAHAHGPQPHAHAAHGHGQLFFDRDLDVDRSAFSPLSADEQHVLLQPLSRVNGAQGLGHAHVHTHMHGHAPPQQQQQPERWDVLGRDLTPLGLGHGHGFGLALLGRPTATHTTHADPSTPPHHHNTATTPNSTPGGPGSPVGLGLAQLQSTVTQATGHGLGFASPSPSPGASPLANGQGQHSLGLGLLGLGGLGLGLGGLGQGRGADGRDREVKGQAQQTPTTAQGLGAGVRGDVEVDVFDDGTILDEIKFEDLKFGPKIGEGTYGEVFQGQLWGQPVAIKKLRMTTQGLKASDIREFNQEVKILRSLRHPNVVEFLGACYVKPRLCMVTEYLPNGSLEALLQRYRAQNKKMSLKRIVQFCSEIARGLNWLHHKGIIHRDLKTENILVTKHTTLKIADFGLSHMKSRGSNDTGFYGVCGTPCYMAPEVLRKAPYGVKCDVFSFGMVCAELVMGEYPFEKDSAAPSGSAAFDEAIMKGLRPRIPDDCHPDMRKLIEQCWREDPEARPTVDEVMARLEELEKKVDEARAGDLGHMIEELPDELQVWFEQQRRKAAELDGDLRAARNKMRALEEELSMEKRTRQELERRLMHLQSIHSRQQQQASAPPPSYSQSVSHQQRMAQQMGMRSGAGQRDRDRDRRDKEGGWERDRDREKERDRERDRDRDKELGASSDVEELRRHLQAHGLGVTIAHTRGGKHGHAERLREQRIREAKAKEGEKEKEKDKEKEQKDKPKEKEKDKEQKDKAKANQAQTTTARADVDAAEAAGVVDSSTSATVHTNGAAASTTTATTQTGVVLAADVSGPAAGPSATTTAVAKAEGREKRRPKRRADKAHAAAVASVALKAVISLAQEKAAKLAAAATTASATTTATTATTAAQAGAESSGSIVSGVFSVAPGSITASPTAAAGGAGEKLGLQPHAPAHAHAHTNGHRGKDSPAMPSSPAFKPKQLGVSAAGATSTAAVGAGRQTNTTANGNGAAAPGKRPARVAAV